MLGVFLGPLIRNFLTLNFASGMRFYIGMALAWAAFVAAQAGIPIQDYGIDLTPDDPMTAVPSGGFMVVLTLIALGIYEKVRSVLALIGVKLPDPPAS